jgi:hypothetical protein
MTDQNLHKETKKSETGKKVLNFLITEANRRKLSSLLKNKARTKMIRQVSGEQESHLDDILRNALKHIVPVTQPLVLISQVHHSGGFLLNQLFDGHPALSTLPHGLWRGSIFDPENKTRDWFDNLFREVDPDIIRDECNRSDMNRADIPFVFVPLIQEQIFQKYLDSLEKIERRDVIDAYITACFGGWLDYQNLNGDKKFTTVCAPDLAAQPGSMEAFFEIYPEGRIISLVRNPEDWLACARTREPEIYADARSAVARWKESIRTALEVNRKFKDRLCLIRFEDLISRTDAVMHYLSDFLDISFDDILLAPTFNSIPLLSPENPKTAYADAASEYVSDSKVLNEDNRILIKKIAQDDYQTILRKTVSI